MKIKVLVPVDLSPRAQVALDCIQLLADREEMDVCLLHCFDDLLIGGPEIIGGDISASQYQTEQVLHRNENDAKEKLTRLEAEVRERLSTVQRVRSTVHSEFAWGRQEDMILEFAEKYQPDLILIVRHGDSSWFGKLFGSVTRDIVGDSTFPVLTITAENGLKGLDHIMFASDFKTGDTEALRRIQRIFSPFEPKISCVHVRQEDEDETDKGTRARLEALGVNVEIVDGEDLTEALKAEMENHQASLLAVNTRLRSHFQQFLHHGVTGHLLDDTKLPILSMHAE